MPWHLWEMQGAWDLGYAWMRQEPSCPALLALAMISTALMWGWTHFAGCSVFAFGALLRPGEVFSLTRLNLLFSRDSGFSVPHLLVSLMEPKRRFTTARHQSTRLDIPDLLDLVTWIFQDLPPHYPICPFSPQTFRNRFRSVFSVLSFPTSHSPLKCLDPGSLRADGATWLMQMTDNGELVRRRGRWQNYRIMEVYIQEVSSLLYLQKVPNEGREQVLKAVQCFTRVFWKAASYKAANLPTTIWFVLFSSCRMPWANGNGTGTVKRYVLVESGFWWRSGVAYLQLLWPHHQQALHQAVPSTHTTEWEKQVCSIWYINASFKTSDAWCKASWKLLENLWKSIFTRSVVEEESSIPAGCVDCL